jgi:hypothetical protein
MIIGEAQQGVSLTTSNTLIDEDGLGAITYQWQANGVTVGTGSQFSLTQAQINKVITVTATYTDDFGTQERVTSQATAAILNKKYADHHGYDFIQVREGIETVISDVEKKYPVFF